jgi:hypothetical protein
MKNLKVWCCTIFTFAISIFLVLSTIIAMFFLMNWINTVIPNSIIIYSALQFSYFTIDNISEYVKKIDDNI